jgi:hypothetical protein
MAMPLPLLLVAVRQVLVLQLSEVLLMALPGLLSQMVMPLPQLLTAVRRVLFLRLL